MKKLLILVLSIMLVAGSFAAAYASDGGMDSVRSAVEGSKVIIGGDMRVRGVCKINHDANDDVDDDNCYWDQRLRLTITAQITGGVEVRSRVMIGEHKYGTDGTTELGQGFGDEAVDTDYAYLHIPVGSVVVDLGHMVYNFANKFLVNDGRVDRLQVSGASGDIAFAVFGDKLEDNFGNEGFLDNDVDQYGVNVVYSANDVEAGALVVFVRDEDSEMDNDGYYGDIYANMNVSGVSIMAEVAAMGGDRFETAGEEDNPWGGFVSAGIVKDALTFTLLGAITQNTFVADTHFTPTNMIGSDSPAAVIELGECSDFCTSGFADTLLIAGTVGFAATPEMDVYGRLAYIDLDEYEGSGDASAFEIDAGLTYDLAANTTYSLDIGYASPDDFTTQDDALISVLSKVQVRF